MSAVNIRTANQARNTLSGWAKGSPVFGRFNADTTPRYVAGALVGGAVVGNSPSIRHRRTPDQRQHARQLTGAALGGAAGEGAWNAAGFSIRARGHTLERERPERMSRNQHQKLMARHHHIQGVPQNTRPDRAHQPEFFRRYPAGLPATKAKHLLGQMSGRRGKMMEAAVVTSAAMLGAGNGHGQRVTTAKGLYQRESRLSPVRGAEFVLGAGLLASGAGRSKMIGRALGHGVRMAQGKDNRLAIDALQTAQAAQGALRIGIQPTERQLRQVRAVDRAVKAVPLHLRPAVAMSAGALLIGNATPVRTTTYRPVASGW